MFGETVVKSVVTLMTTVKSLHSQGFTSPFYIKKEREIFLNVYI